MNPYDNLSYNEFVPTFIGEPVKEIQAINELDQESYDYVRDKILDFKDALSKMKHLDASKDVYQKAVDQLYNLEKTYEEQGDYENKVMDINKFGVDLATTGGLNAVQEQYKNREGTITSLKENKDLADRDISRAVAYLDKKTKSVEYDPVTKTWVNTGYGSIDVPKDINFSEELVKVLSGFNPNTGSFVGKGTLTTADGKEIVKSPDGYYTTVTGERVDEGEVLQAATAYLLSHPDFQHRMQFETMLNKDSLVDENGNPRDVSMEDVKGLLSEDQLKSLLEASGVSSLEELEEKGMSPEDLYDRLFKETSINRYATPLMLKEGYNKQTFNYTTDWIKKEQMQEAAAIRKAAREESASAFAGNPFTVTRLAVTETVTSDDFIKKTDTYRQAKSNAKSVEARIREIQNSLNSGKTDYTLNHLEEAKRELEEYTTSIINLENSLQALHTGVKNELFSKGINLDTTYENYVKESNFIISANANKESDILYRKNSNIPQSKINAILKELGLKELPKDRKTFIEKYKEAMSNKSIVPKKEFDEIVIKKAYDKDGKGIFQSEEGDYGLPEINPFLNITSDKLGSQRVKQKYSFLDDLDRITEVLKESKEHKITTPLDVLYIDPDDKGKNQSSISNFQQFIRDQLSSNPFQFTFQGKPMSELIETLEVNGETLDEDDVDFKTSYANAQIALQEIDGKPTYVVPIYKYRKDTSKDPVLFGHIKVNYNGNPYSQYPMIRETIVDTALSNFGDALENGSLSEYDAFQLNKLGLQYGQTLPASKRLDALNLYSVPVNSQHKWQITDDVAVTITAKQNPKDPDDLNYVLQDASGKYFVRNIETNERDKMTFSELQKAREKDKNWVEEVYDNPYEFKEVIGLGLLKQELRKNLSQKKKLTNAAASSFINDNFYNFGTEIDLDKYTYGFKGAREGLQKVEPEMKRVFNGFESYIRNMGFTGTLQVNSGKNGKHSDDSYHYEGKAIDIQATNDMLKIFGIDPSSIRKMKKFNVIEDAGDYRISYEPPTSSSPGARGHFHINIV